MRIELGLASLAAVVGLLPTGGCAAPPTVGDMVESCAAAAGVESSPVAPINEEVYCLGIAFGMASVLIANCRVAGGIDVGSPYFYATDPPPSNAPVERPRRTPPSRRPPWTGPWRTPIGGALPSTKALPRPSSGRFLAVPTREADRPPCFLGNAALT